MPTVPKDNLLGPTIPRPDSSLLLMALATMEELGRLNPDAPTDEKFPKPKDQRE